VLPNFIQQKNDFKMVLSFTLQNLGSIKVAQK
jgi:hypothetical protein